MKPCEPAVILKAVEQVLAGVPESAAAPSEQFDQDHLLLLTNKLTETSNALLAANARIAALVDLSIQLAAADDARERALGWLCVAEKIGANGFDARDERLLSSVGSLASRLYEAGGPQI
jgi:hypothetical protein